MPAVSDPSFTRFHSFLDRSRWWLLWVGIICLSWSVFCASGVDLNGRWRYYQHGYAEKLQDPFCNLVGVYPSGSHTEKLNYRIAVPLVLHLAGFRDWRTYIPVTLMAIALLPVLAALVVERQGGGRLAALLAGLVVASLSLGSYQLPWLFDAVALCLLTMACIPALHPIATMAAMVAAAFTDERAVVASIPVIFARLNLHRFVPWSPRAWLAGWPVIAGVAVALLLRGVLRAAAGLPFSHVGAGSLYFFHENIATIWGGMWYLFEGGWLVILAAVGILWRRKEWAAMTLVLGSAVAFALVSMTIADLSRSLSYLLPFFFVATRIVGAFDAPLLREKLGRACVLSVLCGTCFFHLTIEWFQPLPMQIADLGVKTALEWWKGSAMDR